MPSRALPIWPEGGQKFKLWPPLLRPTKYKQVRHRPCGAGALALRPNIQRSRRVAHDPINPSDHCSRRVETVPAGSLDRRFAGAAS